MNTELTPQEQVIKARISIRLDKKVAPLAFLLSMFDTILSRKVRTIALTKHMEILINPKFFTQLTENNRKYMLLHELMHFFLKHTKRWKDADSYLLKLAQDMKVNQILAEGGYLPELQTIDINGKVEQLKVFTPYEGFYKYLYKGKHIVNTADKSADEVYDILLKLEEKDPPDNDNQKQDNNDADGGSGASSGNGNGNGESDENNDNNDNQDNDDPRDQQGYMSDCHPSDDSPIQDEPEAETPNRVPSENELDRAIEQTADMLGKNRGLGSSDLTKYINELFESKIDYRYALMKYIQPLVAIGQTWAKPNKRIMASLDIYMPGKVKGGDITVMAAIDTSGSISEQDYRDLLSEIKGLLGQFDQIKVILLVGDTELKHKVEIDNNTDIRTIPYKGGGGTSHEFIYEEMLKHRPVACLMFTDGYSDIEDCEQKFAGKLSTDRMFVLTEPHYKQRLEKYGQTWDLIKQKN